MIVLKNKTVSADAFLSRAQERAAAVDRSSHQQVHLQVENRWRKAKKFKGKQKMCCCGSGLNGAAATAAAAAALVAVAATAAAAAEHVQ